MQGKLGGSFLDHFHYQPGWEKYFFSFHPGSVLFQNISCFPGVEFNPVLFKNSERSLVDLFELALFQVIDVLDFPFYHLNHPSVKTGFGVPVLTFFTPTLFTPTPTLPPQGGGSLLLPLSPGEGVFCFRSPRGKESVTSALPGGGGIKASSNLAEGICQFLTPQGRGSLLLPLSTGEGINN